MSSSLAPSPNTSLPATLQRTRSDAQRPPSGPRHHHHHRGRAAPCLRRTVSSPAALPIPKIERVIAAITAHGLSVPQFVAEFRRELLKIETDENEELVPRSRDERKLVARLGGASRDETLRVIRLYFLQERAQKARRKREVVRLNLLWWPEAGVELPQ